MKGSRKTQAATKRLRRAAGNEKKRRKQHERKRKVREARCRTALRRHRKSALLRCVFGAALALCALFILFALAVDYSRHSEKPREYGMLFFILLVAIAGVYSLQKGLRGLWLQRLYPVYKRALQTPGVDTLALFAAQLQKKQREKRIQMRLLAMLMADFFPGYSLNLSQKTIRIPDKEQDATLPKAASDAAFIRIPCPRCAAENLVREDAVGVCYCCGGAI